MTTPNPNKGRFTWHELLTTDPAKAAVFYSELMGWSRSEMPMGEMGTYTLFKQGDAMVAGMMKSPMPGIPSHWLAYVGVDDVDATARDIAANGGKVVAPPMDVPGMVRFAVAMDREGAAFGIVRGIGAGPEQPLPDGPPRAGTFCWDELHTKDQESAKAFYGAILGWTGYAGEGPMAYWHWKNGDKEIGGMMTLQMPNVPPNWLPYLAVDDVDATAARGASLGGKIAMPAMDLDKVGKFAVLLDSTGAAFALFKSARA